MTMTMGIVTSGNRDGKDGESGDVVLSDIKDWD